MIFNFIRCYFRLAVGCSAYGIHFSAKFVNFDIFTVVAIKEAAVFVIILMIIPFLVPVYSSKLEALYAMTFKRFSKHLWVALETV